MLDAVWESDGLWNENAVWSGVWDDMPRCLTDVPEAGCAAGGEIMGNEVRLHGCWMGGVDMY